MGLIQRAVEEAGISTISITLSKEITKQVRPPRALFPGFPMGHPLSWPYQNFRQLQILRLLLKQLETIETPGTLVELNLMSSDDTLEACVACGINR